MIASLLFLFKLLLETQKLMQNENPMGLIAPVQFFEREGFSQKELTQGTKNPMAEPSPAPPKTSLIK